MTDGKIKAVVNYAVANGLIEETDRTYCINGIISLFGKNDYDDSIPAMDGSIAAVLDSLCDDAVEMGLIDGGTVSRDLFDTKIMGILTPRPSEIIKKFKDLYNESPETATDWYYKLSGDTNYIRRDRIAKILKWQQTGDYGTIDITVNLSKPEKDPKAIAAAKNMPQVGYPKCMLCRECEGYSGRIDFPARQNHRIIPITINNSEWFMQYSPYVYYNEHCIVF
ncbi:MAG: galactose-1-phosphate uridylyltransferase, partial [Clostridia bacterium]|nr:galactose-1-phosphate uridylyltransferase [Clostridia bacterium]